MNEVKLDYLCSASIVTSSLRLLLNMLAPETGTPPPPKAEVQDIGKD